MLAVIWHSRTGTSRAMALAAAEGAGDAARLIAAGEECSDLLLAARGYLFVCPENLGSMSGVMKDLFDRTYYPLLGRVEGRPYATMIAAGTDGHGAQAQIDRIVTGWRLRRVVEGFIHVTGAQRPEDILAPKTISDQVKSRCSEIGQTLAVGLEMGLF